MSGTLLERLEEAVLSDEAGCQFEHRYTPCTKTAAYHCRRACDGKGYNWCSVAYGLYLDRLGRNSDCVDCRTPIKTCWTVYPI